MLVPRSPTSLNGPFIVGYTLCFGLMGVLAIQCFFYFSAFREDRLSLKVLVLVVLILELLMSAFAFHGFWMTATGAFVTTVNPYELESVVHLWSFIAMSPLTGVVTTMTHSFFCWRIWVIRRSIAVLVFVMIFSLLQLVSITYLALTTNLFPINIDNNITVTGTLSPASRSPFLPIWLGSSLLCDLTITTYLALSLRLRKSRYLQSNRSPIPGLITLTIETGLVTTIAALLELILATVFSSTQYHVAVFYTISKLYANCLLASLNYRVVLRNPPDNDRPLVAWLDSVCPSEPVHGASGEGGVMHIVAQVRHDAETDTYPDEDSSHKDLDTVLK